MDVRRQQNVLSARALLWLAILHNFQQSAEKFRSELPKNHPSIAVQGATEQNYVRLGNSLCIPLPRPFAQGHPNLY